MPTVLRTSSEARWMASSSSSETTRVGSTGRRYGSCNDGRAAGNVGSWLRSVVVVFDAEDRAVLHQLETGSGVLRLSWNGSVQATLDDLDRLPDLVTDLVNAGARLTRVEPLRPSLEDLYFEMQRAHREAQ